MLSIAVIVALFGCAFAQGPDPNCGRPAIPPSEGNSLVAGRIVGGKEVDVNSFPHQAQLRYNGGHFCGGSLLRNDIVLTAAHCMRGYSPSSFSIRLGRHTKSATGDARDKFEQISAISSVTIHDAYNPFTINNDVAVIRLATPVSYTDGVSPVCLPSGAAEVADATNVHVTGWGSTEGTCCSTVLKQVMVPIVNRAVWNQPLSYNGAITAGMICAGLEQGGLDSCQGDSGGPLVSQVGGRWEVDGIVSWGSGCADPRKYGVYANTWFYNGWILNQINAFEREEAQVSQKFRPAPFGTAFREMAREMVEKGEVQKADLPMNGAWLE